MASNRLQNASSPDSVINVIFDQIQSAILGYAADQKEALAREEALDRMLVVREVCNEH